MVSARISLVDKIKFKDESEDMDVANLAIVFGSVFAVPKNCPLRGGICKIFSWNLISENVIRKEPGQIWSAPLCGIFVGKNR